MEKQTMKPIADLWGPIEQEDVVAPAAVIKEQAALLGQKTRNLVTAEVALLATREQPLTDTPVAWQKAISTLTKFNPNNFQYGFYIVASPLGNYRYRLFTFSYSMELYPVRFHLSDMLEFTGEQNEGSVEVKDEQELIQTLGALLNSKQTKQVIQSLLAQINALSVNGA